MCFVNVLFIVYIIYSLCYILAIVTIHVGSQTGSGQQHRIRSRTRDHSIVRLNRKSIRLAGLVVLHKIDSIDWIRLAVLTNEVSCFHYFVKSSCESTHSFSVGLIRVIKFRKIYIAHKQTYYLSTALSLIEISFICIILY